MKTMQLASYYILIDFNMCIYLLGSDDFISISSVFTLIQVTINCHQLLFLKHNCYIGLSLAIF